MVWGCMTSQGMGGFCRIEGNMDADLYCDIMRGELMDTISNHDLDPADVVFQHDNDPKHKAVKTTQCLEDLDLKVLFWPPQSPDLNPIEHVWNVLKIELAKYPTPPAGLTELWDRVQEQWLKIPLDYVTTLVESMPRRIAAVLRARGGHTKY